METELSVEIDRPIEEVFDYTLNNVTEWSLTCVEDEMLELKPGHVGSTFRVVTEDHGRRMEFLGEVTEHEAPYKSSVHLKGKQFDIEVWYEFEDLSGRTRVMQRSQIHGHGFYKLMFFLVGWTMKKTSCQALESELDNLRHHCEMR